MPPKRPLERKRQTKLNFSPNSNTSPKPAKMTFVVSSGSDSDSDSDDGPSSSSRPIKRARLQQETERGLNLGMPARQNKRGMFGSSDNEIIVPSDSSSATSEGYGEAHVTPSPRKSGRHTKKTVISDDEEIRPKRKNRAAARRTVASTKDSTDQKSEGEVTVTRRNNKRKRNRATEDSDEEEVRPKKKDRRTSRRASAPTEDSSESGSEGNAADNRQKDARRQMHFVKALERKVSRKDKAGRRAKGAVSLPTELAEQDSEDEVLVTPRQSTRRRTKPAAESSEEEAPQAKRPGGRVRRRTSTPEVDSDLEEQDEESNAEADELKEDLAFLQSSPLGLGSTQNRVKSGREKALEALKKRRAVNSDPPSSSAGRKKPVVVESDSDSDLEVIPEEHNEVSDEEPESDEPDENYTATAQEALYGDEEDDDFINDDDAPIGVPSEHALPLQFSSLRNAKPRDLFKYAIEWMVQKKINPAFPSDDEIYDMTFRKLNDEVNGLASSKYHSSVWTKDFTRAIRARPEIVIGDIDPRTRAIMEPHCEACNRKSHPATFELSFTGKPYHKDTLEPLAANASDSDSDSDSSAISSTGSEAELNGERPTYDAQGERIPPESKVFTLGSTCKANAQVAHTLYHWRHHLYSWVVAYLERQGHCSAEKLVARDKWSDRKRQKYANKVVDEMEKTGEIKRLHRLYQDQVNYALETENEFRKGWGRRG